MKLQLKTKYGSMLQIIWEYGLLAPFMEVKGPISDS
jgi:hypothetical protein